jgi:hypothetical protein
MHLKGEEGHEAMIKEYGGKEKYRSAKAKIKHEAKESRSEEMREKKMKDVPCTHKSRK